MSTCPRTEVKEVITASTTPGTFNSSAPTPRDESCSNTATVITKQGSGSTTTVIVNPNATVPCVLGFKWEGAWALGQNYKAQVCFTNPNGSVVFYNGSSWLCILDHTSSTGDEPTLTDPTPPAINGTHFWKPMSEGATSTAEAKLKADSNKSWYDKVTDWIKDMDIWDWAKVALIGGGLLYYGISLLTSKNSDGTGNGNADKRYNGTLGYNGTYTTPKLKDVLTTLCSKGNITSDVTLISDTEILEFTLANTTSIRSILQQLSIAFNFDMVNSGGILKFVPRTPSVLDTITLADMGYSSNVTPPAPYTSKRFQGISLPRKVNITYFAPTLDYNPFTQTAELFTYPDGNEITSTIPLTLTDIQARKIAELNLINAHLERMNYKFTTSYKYVHLESGDCIQSPMGIIRITKVNETDEGLLSFEACDAGEPSASVLSGLAYVTAPDTGNSDITLGYSESIFIDPPWLGTSDIGIRLYSVTHGYGRSGWPGAMMYISRDGGTNYSPFKTVSVESTWGVANAVLANPTIVTTPGANIGWDITHTLSVELKIGEFTSATDTEVIAGANQIFIGQELVGFGVATLTAPKTYTLSRLKRGLSGTMPFASSHVANELIALKSTLNRIDLEDTDYNKTLKFKTVTMGSGLDVADLDTVTCVSNNNKLWAPNIGSITKQSDNSWLITWTPNIRTPDVINNTSSTMTQTDADQSGWGVAITTSTGSIVSTRPSGFNNYTYTTTEQIADFGSLQNTIYVKVVPMHNKYGGGYPLSFHS